jgi:hypothetical protein
MGSAGLFDDIWAAWTELALNLSLTIVLAPFYGIAGILTAKIISFGIISTFWKPYYVFNNALHKSVWEYWCGMAPYYIIFAFFTALAIWFKIIVIDCHVDNFFSLRTYGSCIAIPMFAVLFIVLFQFTHGMKDFVARKPTVYHILQRVTFN